MDDLRRFLGSLPSHHRVAGVATVTQGRLRVLVRGADEGSVFELGSVSKGLTGLLYADALARGEISPGTLLGDLLPLGACPAATVTLESLSTHRSGLPRLPAAMQPVRRTYALWRHGTNPYGDTLAELLEQTRTVTLSRPRPAYSNLGFELLGHALASAAGTSYGALVGSRLAGPLGMPSVHVPAGPRDLGVGDLTGTSRRGRAREAWTGEAVGPAGGVRASVPDLGRLLLALLDGSAPGRAALEPRHRFGGGARIGAAWLTLEQRGRAVTWHNGRTGGFASWVGLDRSARTGVALLSATAASLDRDGFRLLAQLGSPVSGR